MSIVGARPNFIKIAPILKELAKFEGIEHRLVHSGQHYDELLSGSFFAELALPKPDINLEVGSGSHAVQTAEIMKRLEPAVLEFKPHLILVVGDVNSTIAAALTAVKLGIGVAHVEAGLRSFDMTMPEEINRKLTDAISTLLFVSEESGVENLKREGVPEEKIFFVGNVMIDCLLQHQELASQSPILERLGVRLHGTREDGSGAGRYAVLTLHRPSNVDDPEKLRGILSAASTLAMELPVFFPVHPRTRKNIEKFGLQNHVRESENRGRGGIELLDPLGYLDFLALNANAALVLTDSGGVQEEATVLNVPCLTLRENTERPATVKYGTNQVVGGDPDRIVTAARSVLAGRACRHQYPPLWDGNAAQRIVAILRQHLEHS